MLCCCSYLRHRDAVIALAYIASACWQLWHATIGGSTAGAVQQQPGLEPSAGQALQLFGALSPAFLALACQASLGWFARVLRPAHQKHVYTYLCAAASSQFTAAGAT